MLVSMDEHCINIISTTIYRCKWFSITDYSCVSWGTLLCIIFGSSPYQLFYLSNKKAHLQKISCATIEAIVSSSYNNPWVIRMFDRLGVTLGSGDSSLLSAGETDNVRLTTDADRYRKCEAALYKARLLCLVTSLWRGQGPTNWNSWPRSSAVWFTITIWSWKTTCGEIAGWFGPIYPRLIRI